MRGSSRARRPWPAGLEAPSRRGSPARGLVVALVVAWASVALADAASIVFSDGGIGAASAPVGPCTTSGLGVVPSLSGGSIISVTVSGLPGSCGGASLLVTVDNGTATGNGSSTVPGGGGPVTVTLGSAIALTTDVTTDILLVGP